MQKSLLFFAISIQYLRLDPFLSNLFTIKYQSISFCQMISLNFLNLFPQQTKQSEKNLYQNAPFFTKRAPCVFVINVGCDDTLIVIYVQNDTGHKILQYNQCIFKTVSLIDL